MPTLRQNWPTYALDGLCLGVFMMSAAAWGTWLQHPASPLHNWLTSAVTDAPAGRLLMGVAMGVTAVALIYSPWGARSGAHMNPAVTLTFLWLGKMSRRDAVGYIVAQFVGGTTGLLAAAWLLDGRLGHPAVNYVATTPPNGGGWPAFAGEAVISFVMMTAVLELRGRPRTAPFTGLAAGCLIALFITVEAPLSGMSMNVARSLPSNVLAARAATLWIYAAAPLLGMWLAAVRYVGWHALRRRPAPVECATLYHARHIRCIFCGGWHD